MDSDIEGKEDDDDLPDSKAWGTKKKSYYNTDYVDQDYGGKNWLLYSNGIFHDLN